MESTIIEKIRELPPVLQEEVIHFMDFLRTKKVQNGRKTKYRTERKRKEPIEVL